jgi:LPS export ABC transporter protein LptC
MGMVVGSLGMLASAAWAQVASGAESALTSSSEPQQMKDFNLSGYGERGQKTWEVQGDTMDMVDNEVKIQGLTAHLYNEKDNMVLKAEQGQFDKESGVFHLSDNVRAVTDSGAKMQTETLDWCQKDKTMVTKDKVNISRGNMTAVALGAKAQPDFNIAQLEKDIVMTIHGQEKSDANGEPESSGMEEPFKGHVSITCDGPMELNYNSHVAIFFNNVKVAGDAQQGTMYADKMTATFNPETKQIDKVVAEGNVRIIKGENTSYSDGAIFTAADRRMVLTGRPKLVMFPEGDLNASFGSQGTR